MASEDTNNRVAILLKSLGGDVTNGVLKQMSGDSASKMSSTMLQLDRIPPSDDEVNEVLEEFNRFMEFALSNSDEVLANSDRSSQPVSESPEFVSSGDPFEDLQNLQDYQIAGVLRNENGATSAIILSQLSTEKAGTIMALLPEAIKKVAFLRLQESPVFPPQLLDQVLKTTVERASRLDHTAASDPDNLADEKTATLLRSMDRSTRTEMFAVLEEEKPEVAERVKSLLFVFEDLLAITDKSIQKLLAEVEKSDLAIALKNAEPALVDRITSNLSKRAKAGLLEEIEFLETVTKDSEDEACQKVCDGLAKLDQAGDLNMIE